MEKSEEIGAQDSFIQENRGLHKKVILVYNYGGVGWVWFIDLYSNYTPRLVIIFTIFTSMFSRSSFHDPRKTVHICSSCFG